MRLHSVLSPLRAPAVFVAILAGGAVLAQESTPEKPTGGAEQEEPAKTEVTEPKPEKPALEDRLTVTAGGGVYQIKAGGRSMAQPRRRDPVIPCGDPTLCKGLLPQQTIDLSFDTASGPALLLSAEYRITQRFFARMEYLKPSAGNADMTDQRWIDKHRAPGDFIMAGFESTTSPDYEEVSIGGAFRLWPGKKKGVGSRTYVDAIVENRTSKTRYVFQVGPITQNPFDPNALMAGNFDTLGLPSGNYTMNFGTLSGGVRIGTRITDNVLIEGSFVPVWFARFDAQAELPHHGLVFVHNFMDHLDPNFSTGPNCNSRDDPNNPLTPNCGLLEGDLKTTDVNIRQRSSRGSGLGLDLNVEVKVTDWMAIVAGYHRQDFRSIGGTENRDFKAEPALGCAPNAQNQPRCDENGELVHVDTLRQGVFVQGRFRFF
jgi:hypothetical protein